MANASFSINRAVQFFGTHDTNLGTSLCFARNVYRHIRRLSMYRTRVHLPHDASLDNQPPAQLHIPQQDKCSIAQNAPPCAANLQEIRSVVRPVHDARYEKKIDELCASQHARDGSDASPRISGYRSALCSSLPAEPPSKPALSLLIHKRPLLNYVD